MSPSPLVLGSSAPAVTALAAALGTTALPVPRPALGGDPLGWAWAEELDRWRDEHAGAGGVDVVVDRVVVAVWDETVTWAPLADTGLDDWLDRCEVPLARWWAALGVAVQRCADGGVIVAVVERPPPLDAAGWGPAAAVADAAENMVRSLARSEGGRGVRVNAVTTPVRLQHPPLVDPAPSLATFPGTVEHEVVGAVRMLLGADAAGVTGTAVHADCGRSWR